MKNLLIYISPNKQLNPEHQLMLEAQLENSLDYWAKEDIVLAFNFPYKYKGFQAIKVPDLLNSQSPDNPRAIINSKINVIIYLLENKIITETAWFHDFDAFQLAPLKPPEIRSIGLVTYGIYPQHRLQPIGDYKTRVNCGSIFFPPESLETFKELLTRMDRNRHYEEDSGWPPMACQRLDTASRVMCGSRGTRRTGSCLLGCNPSRSSSAVRSRSSRFRKQLARWASVGTGSLLPGG